MPPPDDELATAVLAALETPPDAAAEAYDPPEEIDVPVACADVPAVVPLTLLLAALIVFATTFNCSALLLFLLSLFSVLFAPVCFEQ